MYKQFFKAETEGERERELNWTELNVLLIRPWAHFSGGKHICIITREHTLLFVGGVCSFKDVHTNYIHAYIHNIHFDTYLRNQCTENIPTFRIVKAFMRYVARRNRGNLLVAANKRANLKLEGQLKYFLGTHSVISVYFRQTRIKWTSVSESPTQKGQKRSTGVTSLR